MDTQRLNALLVARGLLDRGRTAVDGTGPGAMASVVLFDLAVETAAKAMRRLIPPSAIRARTISRRPASSPSP